MKNILILIGSIAFAGSVGFFCYTMLQNKDPYAGRNFSFQQDDAIEKKKSEVVDRIDTLREKPLSPGERQTILQEFGNGNGAKYNLTKEEQLKIMESLNKKPTNN